jgi:hypothetical protein
MLKMSEVIIKLGPDDIQQVLAIDLDGDPEDALRFLKEKLVDKFLQPECRQLSRPGPHPCKFRRCSTVCCRSGHNRKWALEKG